MVVPNLKKIRSLKNELMGLFKENDRSFEKLQSVAKEIGNS